MGVDVETITVEGVEEVVNVVSVTSPCDVIATIDEEEMIDADATVPPVVMIVDEAEAALVPVIATLTEDGMTDADPDPEAVLAPDPALDLNHSLVYSQRRADTLLHITRF